MSSGYITLSGFVWKVLSSRLGLLIIACGLLYSWHVVDRRQAVAAAREGFVQQIELTAAQAEIDALRRRAAVTTEANRVLQEKMQVAEGQALRFAVELEAYQNETVVNPDGVVDSDLLGRLRSN